MQIGQIQNRLWDLLPIVRRNVYHPDLEGRIHLRMCCRHSSLE
jgi:hypothetical protein